MSARKVILVVNMSKKLTSLFKKRPNAIIAAMVAVLVIAVGTVVISISAAGFFAANEPEDGALTSNAKLVADASASGGKAIQFTAPVAPPPPPPSSSAWPDATNTGYEPTGVALTNYTGPCTITAANTTIDAKTINCDLTVRANNVHITRSLIKGAINSGSYSEQSGLVISDTTIQCGCLSVGATDTPSAIQESNYTLLRVNLSGSGHGAAIRNNVVIQDSWIHGLGGNTDAHKDGVFSGGGTNVTIRHNNIECNDGSHAGCTSAIGLLTDFEVTTYHTIDNNLLNTNGASCFYAWGGPQKAYKSNHITFTNNHFGRKINGKCGSEGPVAYWDKTQPGMVWSGNVWDDTGAVVPEPTSW